MKLFSEDSDFQVGCGDKWGLSSSCLPCVSVFISRVWSEWIIENDTFTGMLYTVGEQCGSVDRQAQV